MTVRNVLGIWRFARDNFLQEMERTSVFFIGSRFPCIYKEEEFSELPQHLLRILLASDQINCAEGYVWEGLMIWLNNNKVDLAEIRQTMKTVIRFGLFKHDFFWGRVRPVLEEVSFNNLTLTGNWTYQPRCPQSLLFTFGGWSGSSPVSSISVLDPAANKWTDLSVSLPHNWAYMASVVVGIDVFLCGGHMEEDRVRASNVLMKFNPNTMMMTRLSNMRESRNFLSLAVHKGIIYAMGGKNNQNQ